MDVKETISREEINTIEMLKYVFFDNKSLKQIHNLLHQMSELKKDDYMLKYINKQDDTQTIFKKIHITFKILNQLLRILILRVDDEIYKEALINTVKFPKTQDVLITIVGTFYKSFNAETSDILYQIINFTHYEDFYTIAEINNLLIPFVANDKIDKKKIKTDFDEFLLLVRDFACEVLNVNIYFEQHDIIEIDNSEINNDD